jgi:hypothetical protein
LSSIKGATVSGSKKDKEGRVGVEISFSYAIDKTFPAVRMTSDQYVRIAVAAGVKAPNAAPDRNSFTMPKRHLIRKWKIRVLVDPHSGELLQTSRWDWGTATFPGSKDIVQIPVITSRKGINKLRFVNVEGGEMGRSAPGDDSAPVVTVWLERSKTTDLSSRQSICETHPIVCTPNPTK